MAGAADIAVRSNRNQPTVTKIEMDEAMKFDAKHSLKFDAPLVLPLIVLGILLSMAGYFAPAAQAADAPPPTTFATPSEAGQALLAANRTDDQDALKRIFGADAQALLSSGNSEDDKSARQSFVTRYEKMSRWVAMTDGSEVLYIGADNYPFPIPLVQSSSSRWYFDVAAGKDEILARRIGRNELRAIDTSWAIVETQHQYLQAAHEPSLGPITPGQPLVLDGYSFRILTAQVDAAPGGGKSSGAKDSKTSGNFVIVASPVNFGETGIMTFITASDGTMYEQNLGPETSKIAASLRDFNPTEDWAVVE